MKMECYSSMIVDAFYGVIINALVLTGSFENGAYVITRWRAQTSGTFVNMLKSIPLIRQ
jgi:hypothetical protein